jgi:glutamate-1-semialdehyde 2,1-aminomutase
MTASEALFDRAKAVIPGGVNSPVRAFKAVGNTPVFIDHGKGSRMFSADGQELVDLCGSWGPLALGHAHPAVVEAIRRAASAGTSFGACTEREVELAELLCARIPYMERVRLVNSGTEACMTAIRLARGHTGRNKIMKFDGCYHGHSDALLVSAGSGMLTGGIASSAGVPECVATDTMVCPYNDLPAVESLLRQHGHDMAAVIVEPVAGNMGLVPPESGFLEGLRRLTEESGALLILDEVITGFRLGPTTYGALRGITPDLTCLGKIIGGGMPIGAIGGRAGIMDRLAPLGPVYQAGTLSGNPVAVAAGLSTLRTLIAENPYPAIERLGKRVADEIGKRTTPSGLKAHVAQLGGMFTLFFCDGPVRNMAEAKRCDTAAYARFFQEMLKRGFYLPPSQFEVCFISAAHTREDITDFLAGAEGALSL